MGNISKPLTGGNELLLTHQEISGSVEYHTALESMESIVLKRRSQKDKELVEEPNSFIHRPKEGMGNDPIFGERRVSSLNQLQNSSKKRPKDLIRNREVPKTIKERTKEKKIGTGLNHKGTGVSNWDLLPQKVC
ncbi:hypothetical protein O181_033039 [Austropuccinia psidii MF-1]|uniref:Uncharacterized protein n=1 Tax=Austropuccinia psidii MF-1 TaxID=1389203 RepID=A0A9Q3CYH2_9BASI|nr:hypothetical protein [Austropuccinia psidii MF-1]